jgi:hypothetical protein
MSDRPVSRTRSSREYYVDGLGEPALRKRVVEACADHDYFTSMLREDAGFVLPYGATGDDGFTAGLAPVHDDRVAELVANALAPEDRGHGWLPSALRDFVNRAAQLLVTCGPLTYEVDLLSFADADPSDSPFAFELHLVQPGTLDLKRGRPIQYVPRSLAQATSPDGLGYVHLDPDLLVTIRLDERTEGEVTRAVRFLQAASDQQRAEFALVEQSMQRQTPYQPMVHADKTGDMIAAATRPIGWTVRGLYTKHRLDPYVAWRNLRFLAFKIRLRDTALGGVNQALALAGAHVGFNARVEVSGVPTLADVEVAIEELESGRRSLTELIRMSI